MTRKEAINNVKRLLGYSQICDEALQTLIPELKESEDERMLREIKRYIKEQGDKPTGLPNGTVAVSDMIAWLEKQKDASKAIEAVDRIDKYIDEHLANAHDMKDSNPDKKYYRGWDDALGKMAGILQDVYSGEKQKESLRDFIDDFPYSDEQKEQKPEWNKVTINGEPIPTENKSVDISLAKWNEEDETRLTNTLIMLKEYAIHHYSKDDVEKSVDWLENRVKFLRPQPKQEWNKEDEKIIDDAYCWLCEYAGSLLQKNYGKSSMLYGIANKLKSLRPQYHGDVTMTEAYKMGLEAGKASSWKPSEEQMKAMSYFVRKHQATANRATTKWPEFEAFKSLYNDLKKRM